MARLGTIKIEIDTKPIAKAMISVIRFEMVLYMVNREYDKALDCIIALVEAEITLKYG